MDSVKMGAFLKTLRKEKGWTQQQLADQLYTTNRTVSRWENGVNLPDLDVLLTLSDLYQVSVSDLLAGQRTQAVTSPTENQLLSELADYSQNREVRLSLRFFIIGCCEATATGMTGWLGLKFNEYANSGWLVAGFIFAIWLFFHILIQQKAKKAQKPISASALLLEIAA